MKRNYCLLLLLLLAAANLSASTLSSRTECDTILTTEGKSYICQIYHQNARETQFSLCDDVKNTLYAIQNDRIKSIRKGKELPAIVVEKLPVHEKLRKKTPGSKTKKQGKQTNQQTQSIESQVNHAFTMGVFSVIFSATLFLIPLGFIFGIVSIGKCARLLKRIKGHAKARKMRRKLYWALFLGIISTLFSIVFLFWVLHFLLTWDGIMSGPISIGFSGNWLLGG